MQKSKLAWEEVAHDFAQMVDNDFHRKFILFPALKILLNHSFSSLGGIEGKFVFDAGCGDGGVARYISEKGANVIAVDFSENILDEAKRKTNARAQIKYENINLLKPLPYPSRTFDVAVCSLVLMDMPYVKKPLKELSRILKKKGEIVITISHPCFTTPMVKISRNIIDKVTGGDSTIEVKSYPLFKYVEKKIAGLSKTTPYFHRQISFYINALASSGIRILEMREPLLPKRFKKLMPHLSHATKVPIFLLLRGKKVKKPSQILDDLV